MDNYINLGCINLKCLLNTKAGVFLYKQVHVDSPDFISQK